MSAGNSTYLWRRQFSIYFPIDKLKITDWVQVFTNIWDSTNNPSMQWCPEIFLMGFESTLHIHMTDFRVEYLNLFLKDAPLKHFETCKSFPHCTLQFNIELSLKIVILIKLKRSSPLSHQHPKHISGYNHKS